MIFSTFSIRFLWLCRKILVSQYQPNSLESISIDGWASYSLISTFLVKINDNIFFWIRTYITIIGSNSYQERRENLCRHLVAVQNFFSSWLLSLILSRTQKMKNSGLMRWMHSDFLELWAWAIRFCIQKGKMQNHKK